MGAPAPRRDTGCGPPHGLLPPFAAPSGSAWDAAIPPRRPDGSALEESLEALRGVGRVTAERARGFGLATIADLLSHLPARYEDFAEGARSIVDVAIGEDATVRVELEKISVRPTRRRRLRIVQARVRDETGLLLAIWFNRDYLARVLAPGDLLLLRGRVRAGAPPEMNVQTHEVLRGSADEHGGVTEGLHTTGLVPVYPATEALPSRRIRELVDAARPLARGLRDPLPLWMRARVGVPSLSEAVAAAHFPRRRADARLGRRRLVIGELVTLQLGLLALMRREVTSGVAMPLVGEGGAARAVRASLPFQLTGEQEHALAQVTSDIARTRPMRRLLQGEVGSGKTLVAALAMCIAIEADAQAAILVPTETLAEQHLRNLDAVLAPAGISPVLLTGRVQGAERERRLMAIRTGTAPVVVGTQALLSEGVEFARLGLVVVDEQHRFGVAQRSALTSRAGGRAHVLYMTATPIPRTMALTAFGDLLVSVIRRRPPGRSPVATEWVREPDRDEAYARVREQLRAGRQAYVICPRVERDDDGRRSAVAEAERLAAGPFAGFAVGLAHGAQSSDQKRQAMLDFTEGRTHILVATTVVEVGIDVANATVMLIEDADRFGLAQLHQLRGRVGRDVHPGLCMLFGEPVSEDGARRLEAMTQVTDGFALAELDLDMRGEGTVLGARQSGATDLRFARLARDRRELAEARHLARKALERDPRLLAPEHGPLRAAVLERFPDIPRLLEA